MYHKALWRDATSVLTWHQGSRLATSCLQASATAATVDSDVVLDQLGPAHTSATTGLIYAPRASKRVFRFLPADSQTDLQSFILATGLRAASSTNISPLERNVNAAALSPDSARRFSTVREGVLGRWATYTFSRSEQVLAQRLQIGGRVRKDD